MAWLIYNPSRSDDAGRMLFWFKDAQGLTDDIRAAGRFDESFAKHIQNISSGETRAVPLVLVEKLKSRQIIDLGDAANRNALEARQ
ncbi:hypothetical protein [Zoogloea sp.]|jgi:hypothetical protein|uniref:hypothetical protein n=1 Tax=Zoogloea sp. TaxID=49181 RepID=UPI0037D9BB8A